ncbi:hypothetical protein ACQ4M3_26570 [Leptolyngbya sp. AN03gr2]|uniref:hypothetical protein n=1 Tax=unclassified Leptolyngbya TaxID=2650499 RepID=UPI003D31882C
MPPRNVGSIKAANLSITNKTLKLDTPYIVYQVKNIASVNKFVTQPDQNDSILRSINQEIQSVQLQIASKVPILGFAIFVIGICAIVLLSSAFHASDFVALVRLVAGLGIIYALWKAKANHTLDSLKYGKYTPLVALIPLLYLLGGNVFTLMFMGGGFLVLYRTQNKINDHKNEISKLNDKISHRMIDGVRYCISISTNDSRSFTIRHRYEPFVDEVMAKLHEVMENQDTSVHYHFQVEGDVIQQSGNFGVGVNQGSIDNLSI